MIHARQSLRHFVADLLRGKTDASERVEATRFMPHASASLAKGGPFVAVYTISETGDEENTSPRQVKRLLSLAVEVLAADLKAAPGEDVIDRISKQVEDLIDTSPTLQGIETGPSDARVAPLARKVSFASFELEADTDGEINVMGGRTIFNVDHITTPPAAELADFNRFGTGWDMREPVDEQLGIGPPDTIDASDQTDIIE